MRAIRPPSNTKVTAVFSPPAGSIQAVTAPSSSSVAIAAPGANC
jgi:hypothetical protein